MRNPHTGFREGEQAPDRHGVIRSKHRSRAGVARGERAAREIPGLFGEIPVDHARYAAGAEARTIAAHTLQRLEVVRRAADVGNILIAGGHQVRGHGARATEIIDHERRSDAGGLVGVHEHRRQAARQRVFQARAADVRRHHQQTIDAPVHRSQRLGCLRVIAMRARDQQVQAARPRRAVHAADQLGEILPVDIRQQQPDGVGTAADQAARRGVGRVMQPARGAQHALANARGHRAGVVEGAGHRGNRHPRPPRHVLNRRCHTLSAAAAMLPSRRQVNVFRESSQPLL